jgi:hypothetical protein
MFVISRRSAVALLLAVACIYVAPGRAAANEVTDVIFETVEKRLIREYFASQDSLGQAKSDRKHRGKGKKNKHGKKGLPPGLAKRGSLPPGLAKREQLPPGLAKRGLPDTLSAILPNAAAGTERVIVGRDVVLIEAATGIVLDVLLDVVRQAQ